MTDDARTRRLRERITALPAAGGSITFATSNEQMSEPGHTDLVRRSDVLAVLDTEGDRLPLWQDHGFVTDFVEELRDLDFNGSVVALVDLLQHGRPTSPFPPARDTEWDRPMETSGTSSAAVPPDTVFVVGAEKDSLQGSWTDTEGDRPAQLPCGCYIAQCPTHRSQAVAGRGDASPAPRPTRYDLVTNYRCGDAIEEMEQSNNGEWVRYEDVFPDPPVQP